MIPRFIVMFTECFIFGTHFVLVSSDYKILLYLLTSSLRIILRQHRSRTSLKNVVYMLILIIDIFGLFSSCFGGFWWRG